MSSPGFFGFSARRGIGSGAEPSPIEHVMVQRPLHRVLAFTRRSIDDVVNDPIAKNEVLGYYKLYKQIERSSEITELEKQWNAIG